MNIRSVYWALLIGLSLTLLFQWTSEKREESVSEHLLSAQTSSLSVSDGLVSIENNELYVVVSVATGNIVETRLKEYPVENVEGSLGYRVFGESNDTAFNYYFKSGFTNTFPLYAVKDLGSDYVLLADEKLGLVKKISFSDSRYELSIVDESLVGVGGKVFASLYRTDGKALDLKRGALDGGMMNNSSYEGVAISSERDPYDTYRLSRIDEKKEVLTRSGWIAFVQKYFFAALIGSDEYIYNYQIFPQDSGIYRMGYTVENSSGNVSKSHEHRLFVGPKVRKDLMERADNLELSIDMGWFWFLAQPMVLVMDWINGYLNNWGVTIIVFTIMIKLLFGL